MATSPIQAALNQKSSTEVAKKEAQIMYELRNLDNAIQHLLEANEELKNRLYPVSVAKDEESNPSIPPGCFSPVANNIRNATIKIEYIREQTVKMIECLDI